MIERRLLGPSEENSKKKIAKFGMISIYSDVSHTIDAYYFMKSMRE